MCSRCRMTAKETEIARICGFDLPYAPDEFYLPPAEIFPKRPAYVVADVWKPSETGPVFTFLITEPNSSVALIHPKAMPAISHDEGYGRWLRAPIEEALTSAAPYPARLMTVSAPVYLARGN